MTQGGFTPFEPCEVGVNLGGFLRVLSLREKRLMRGWEFAIGWAAPLPKPLPAGDRLHCAINADFGVNWAEFCGFRERAG